MPRKKSPPKKPFRPNSAELLEIATQIREKVRNIYEVTRFVCPQALGEVDGDWIFEQLREEPYRLFKCDECNHWQPMELLYPGYESACDDCISGMEEDVDEEEDDWGDDD